MNNIGFVRSVRLRHVAIDVEVLGRPRQPQLDPVYLLRHYYLAAQSRIHLRTKKNLIYISEPVSFEPLVLTAKNGAMSRRSSSSSVASGRRSKWSSDST